VADLIRKMLGAYITPDEEEILKAINNSGLKTMRVMGRGTLVVDAQEVTKTDKFKDYAKQAKSVVAQE